MADATFQQTSFLGGEWSQAMQGRADRPDYRVAMNSCLNGIPIDTGAWTRRPGFKFAATSRSGFQAYVITFSFQESTPYTMEFTSGFLRFLNEANSVTTNDDQTITSISSANPAKVLTAAAHGWLSLDQVFFKGLGTSMPLLQNRQFTMTKTSATEFTLTDSLTQATIDGATLGSLPVGATVARVLDLPTPFSAPNLANIRSVQAEKQSVLLWGGLPQVLTATPTTVEDEFASFSLAPSDFKDGPYLDPFTNGALANPSGKTGTVDITISFAPYDATRAYTTGDLVTYSAVNYRSLTATNLNHQPDISASHWVAVSSASAINDGLGFLATDIGRHVRLFSEPPLWATGTVYSAGNDVKYNGAYYRCITGHTASTSNGPGLSLTNWGISPASAVWSWGKITALTNSISGSLSGSVHIGDMTGQAGVNAAFNGTFNQTAAQSAQRATGNVGTSTATLTAFLGTNFAGATDQIIYSVSIVAATNKGMLDMSLFTGARYDDYTNKCGVEYQLRAKQTAPASATDGTLLGTTGVHNAGDFSSAGTVTVLSTDAVTAWKYVWVSIHLYLPLPITDYSPVYTHWNAGLTVAQCTFQNPPGTSTGAGCTVQLLGPPLLYTTSISTWRLGVFNDTTGWPTCGTYHEGRLWLSGVVSNRIDASVSNKLFVFSPTETDGTVTDASAISYTFDAPDVNAIFWMKPDQQGIIVGTQAGEWLVQASALNSPLTPLSMQAHRVTTIGCANIEPTNCEHTLVFVQKHKRKLMEYFADVYSGKFSAPNLALTAKHLAARGFEQITYQEELSPIIWARCTDGSLVGASYKRESLVSAQGPTFVGWHQHTLGSSRVVESMCAGPSTDGLLDTLTIVTNDTTTNVRHIEVLTNLFAEGSDLTDAWFLDDAIVPTFTQNVVLGGVSSFQLSGLWPLNGKTVAVFAGGLDCGNYLVTAGSCAVPFGVAGGLFTPAFVATFGGNMPVVAGFSYSSRGQLLRPATPQDSGARNGPAFGKKRRIQQVALQCVDTQGLSYGTSFTKLVPAAFKTDGGTPYASNALFSGIFRDTVPDESSYNSMICWEVTRPLPATVAAVGGFLQTQDS